MWSKLKVLALVEGEVVVIGREVEEEAPLEVVVEDLLRDFDAALYILTSIHDSNNSPGTWMTETSYSILHLPVSHTR